MNHIRIVFLTCSAFVCLQTAITAGPPHPDDEVWQTRLRMLSANRSMTLLVSISIQPHYTKPMLICRLINKGPGNAGVDELFHLDNLFVFVRNGQSRQIGYTAHSPNSIIVKEGDEFVWKVSVQELVEFAGGGNWMPGQTSRIQWKCANTLSRPLWIAVTDPNSISSSQVHSTNDSTAKSILAFVFNENQTNEVGFLFLNGSNETVIVEKPLAQASRIVATAPAIGYTNELFIAGQPSETVAIEAGKVGEWRIPWQTIHDLIPASDLAAIKAAGGDLDLVWKVGNFQSDPLPISLAEPENNAPPE